MRCSTSLTSQLSLAAAGVPDQVEFATRPALARQTIAAALDAGVPARVTVNDGHTLIRVDDLAERIPTRRWQQHSRGPGAKGTRDYLWAWIITATQPGEHRWLLIRRNRTTGELASYPCWSPKPAPLHTLVTVASSRRSIEEPFQTGEGQAGLDHYQVRGWTGWHRFITLTMLAMAVRRAPAC
ncbi:hypothetical protein [Micromonospora sp. NPDC023814]|uniref:hypothetical protein n=1 Tax=Micromonospora sp. NPDC023814 TaxID=3154596 RepID=UPI0033C50B83